MAEEKKSGIESGEAATSKSESELETGASGQVSEQIELKKGKEAAAEKEMAVAETKGSYDKILKRVKSETLLADEKSISTDAQSVSEAETAESRVANLVNLAVQKGVIHAVKVARHLEDNYTLDEMHDRLLADDLHEALVKKGLLKEL